MEKLNYKFLNYKKYSNFINDLNNNKINNNSIVFIQDNLRIWARGKEYVCNGVGDASLENGVLSFRDSLNNPVFKLRLNGNTISVIDSNNSVCSMQVVLSGEMEQFRSNLQSQLQVINQDASNIRQNIYALNNQLMQNINSLDNRLQSRLNALEQSDLRILGQLSNKQDRIVFDQRINSQSPNAVENRAIAEELNNYARKSQLSSVLSTKQDKLVLGDGLAFKNNKLEVTLDREPFVIVDELPQDPDLNKIYMVLQIVDGEMKYFSYKWDGEAWAIIGDQTPKIDLSAYAKIADSDEKYTTPSYITEQLQELQELINDTYQKKANYAQIGYLNQRLEDLQRIIDAKYVLKKDVYVPDREWSSTDIVDMGDHTVIDVESGQGSGSGGSNNMVTLSEAKYQWLASLNAINPYTYYFTYEGEEETSNWTFGDTFPIVFGENGIGTFPITLGEDNIGTFPINLT